ncbi:hypothetical protein NA57DRAFT_73485 [Rhizodiscina lignyota]|uniref:Uncharacterized protein n=1 Tax=Rhizodiscina lignyota TaxID=1504668 RepID=A0A9P4II29_9PEZI|nr:hypothetical protein NA57DRAFT_73485 [Rhizodiscina lignyota]
MSQTSDYDSFPNLDTSDYGSFPNLESSDYGSMPSMSHSSDIPRFEKDYTFRAKRGFTATTAKTREIQIFEGDVGTILTNNELEKTCVVQVERTPEHSATESGILPGEIKPDVHKFEVSHEDIEPGVKVIPGQFSIEFEHLAKEREGKKFDIPIPADQDQVYKALDALVRSIHAARGEGLDIVGTKWVSEMGETGSNIPKFVYKMHEGFRQAGVLDVLNKPNFTREELLEAAVKIDSKNEKGNHGIYLCDYSDFVPTDELPGVWPDGSSRQYVGSTNNFSLQWQQHKNDCFDENRKDWHFYPYKVMHAARTRLAIVLCRQTIDDKSEREVREQVCMLLMETYNSRLFNPKLSPSTVASTNETHKQNLGAWTATYADMSDCAIRLKAIADKAKMISGWPGATTRASFCGQEQSVTDGLNRASPIFEESGFEKRLWVLTEAEFPGIGKVENYRRGVPYKCRKVLRNHEDGGKDHCDHYQLYTLRVNSPRDPKEKIFVVNFQTNEGELPPQGTPVYPTFEIVPEGQMHPYPLALLPDIGPFSDWSDAARLGARFEWQDLKTGQWKELYYQFTQTLLMYNPDVPGSLKPYVDATGIIRHLKRHLLDSRELDPERDEWRPPFGMARVIRAEFDWFTQTYRFSEQLGKSAIPWKAHRKSEDEIIEEMKKVGLENIGGAFGRASLNKLGKGNTSGHRRECDSCYVYERTTGAQPECKQLPGTETCPRCKDIGRPCSWTSESLLLSNETMIWALTSRMQSKDASREGLDPELFCVDPDEEKVYQFSGMHKPPAEDD